MPPAARDVLEFWFDTAQKVHWFEKNAAFDAQIRSRFGGLHHQAADGELDSWTLEPESWLALLIMLDQFSRNLYRDDAHAYAADAKVCNILLPGLARGDDKQLSTIQRVFVYVPLEHAEDLNLQNRAIDLFTQLSKDDALDDRPTYLNFLDYARRHRDVIARFGRFPHRNQVMGRVDRGGAGVSCGAVSRLLISWTTEWKRRKPCVVCLPLPCSCSLGFQQFMPPRPCVSVARCSR